MEIRDYKGEIKPGVAVQDMVEGRMVFITTHDHTYDFGSREDLVGADLPDAADEAKRARFIVTWPVTDQKPPFYSPESSYSFPWALRGGLDRTANLPMTSMTIRATWPGNQDGQTIPSGVLVRLFGAGTYTVPSGSYVASANLVKGALLAVAYDSGNEGKLTYQATFDHDLVVGLVDELASDGKLTFTLMEF